MEYRDVDQYPLFPKQYPGVSVEATIAEREKVLALADVKGRPIYSKGRKAEAEAKLVRVKKNTF